MSGGLGTAAAVSFVWLGIGRSVFRALNAIEAILAVVVIVALLAGEVPDRVLVAAGCAVAVLLVQLVAIRPLLTTRSDRVLVGEDPGRSRVHLLYGAAEVLKVAAPVSAAVLALNAA